MSEWSKEDKIAFNRSEVMVEFEKRLISVAHALSKKIEKVADIKAQTEEVKALNAEIAKATEGLANMNMTSDHLVNNLDADIVEGNQEDLKEEGLLEDALKAEETMEKDQAEEQMIEEMEALAQMAISEGNYKVAYQIERTISEIIDGE